MKVHIVLIIPALLFLPGLATAQGNLVVNGSFNTITGNDAAGWTLTGAAYANVKNGNPFPDVVLGDEQSASQTISSLNPGTLYIVSGDYECSGTDATDVSFQVTLNGVPFFQTGVPTNPNWNSFSFGYTANSSSAILSLSQIYEAYLSVGPYSIDNIAIYAVPEPRILDLFTVCFLFLYRRIRQPNT